MAEAIKKRIKGKAPAGQFYWKDWLTDSALRSTSSGARGLWMDILCLMWTCVPRGYLQNPNGDPFSIEQICRNTGNLDKEEVQRWLVELENSGVPSRSATGVLYSRRIVRDEHKRALCREAGRKGGGNPRLKKSSTGETFKGTSKGRVKGVSKRKSNPSSSPSGEDGSPPRSAVPPTLADVVGYCQERGNSVNAQKWFDHYTSNGWMVGKNKMKDWRAAVRTWEQNSIPGKPQSDLFAGQREAVERRANGESRFGL